MENQSDKKSNGLNEKDENPSSIQNISNPETENNDEGVYQKKNADFVNEMVQTSAKNVAKNTIYAILNVYLSLPLSIISVYLISRFLYTSNWDFFIYSTTFITSAHIILTYFPPNYDNMLYFKGIEMVIYKKHAELKSAILFGVRIKLIAGGIICCGYYIVMLFILPTWLNVNQLPYWDTRITTISYFSSIAFHDF